MDGFVPLLNDVARMWAGHAIAIAWQAAVLVAVLFLCDRLLARRTRAAVRYALWLLVLLKLLLPPGFALPTSPWYWRAGAEGSHPAAGAGSVYRLLIGVDADDRSGFTDPAPAARSPRHPRVQPRLSAEGWVFVGWLAGMAILLGCLARQAIRVRGAMARARPASAGVQEVFHDCARRLGVRRRPRLAVSGELGTPSVCGLARPVVLLPAGLAERLEAAQLEDVFVHELAHVRRGDLWWNHLQVLLLVAYWWHPAVWLAYLRLRVLREEATDEAVVVARRGDPAGYAETLVDVARAAVARPIVSLGLVGILERRRALRGRIERLVTLPVPSTSRIGFRGWCGLVLAAAFWLPMGHGDGRAKADPKPVLAGAVGSTGATVAAASPAVSTGGTTPVAAGVVPSGAGAFAASTNVSRGRSRLRAKLEALRIQELAFDDASVPEVVRWLKNAAKAADPESQGMNFFIYPGPEDGTTGAVREPFRLEDVVVRIDPPLRDVRFIDALDAIVKAASKPIHYAIEDYAVVLANGSTRAQLVTRVFRVEGRAFEEGIRKALGEPTGPPHAGKPPGPYLEATPIVPEAWKDRRGEDLPTPSPAVQDLVCEFFQAAGISLNPPNAVFYNDRLGLLMVRATAPEMEIVTQAIEVVSPVNPR